MAQVLHLITTGGAATEGAANTQQEKKGPSWIKIRTWSVGVQYLNKMLVIKPATVSYMLLLNISVSWIKLFMYAPFIHMKNPQY